MAHFYPTEQNNYMHVFCCDNCGRLAGANRNENVARLAAYNTVKNEGWKEAHPHWCFYCPSCKEVPNGNETV